MKCRAILVALYAFVVSYKIVSQAPGACGPKDVPDPYTGVCTVKYQQTQVKFFDDYKAIRKWRKEIPKDKGYEFLELTVYKESDEFLKKSDPKSTYGNYPDEK